MHVIIISSNWKIDFLNRRNKVTNSSKDNKFPLDLTCYIAISSKRTNFKDKMRHFLHFYTYVMYKDNQDMYLNMYVFYIDICFISRVYFFQYFSIFRSRCGSIKIIKNKIYFSNFCKLNIVVNEINLLNRLWLYKICEVILMSQIFLAPRK